jgi:hypothetical protein
MNDYIISNSMESGQIVGQEDKQTYIQFCKQLGQSVRLESLAVYEIIKCLYAYDFVL